MCEREGLGIPAGREERKGLIDRICVRRVVGRGCSVEM